MTISIGKPFFSVIVPTYNRSKFIPELLDRIAKQSFKNYELIVVDDGSTDGTSKLFRAVADKRIKFYRIKNSERGAARNFGAQTALGKYINFFDSDDLMMPNHLMTAFNELAQNPVPILRLDHSFMDKDGNIKSYRAFTDEQSSILFDNFFSINSIFLRSDIVSEFKFPEDRRLASSEDWALWIRLAARYEFNNVRESTSIIRLHEGRSLNTFSPQKVMSRDRLLIEYLSSDIKVRELYGIRFRKFCAERYTFFMLKFAEEKSYKTFYYCASRALMFWPATILSKRFIAAWKNICLQSTRR